MHDALRALLLRLTLGVASFFLATCAPTEFGCEAYLSCDTGGDAGSAGDAGASGTDSSGTGGDGAQSGGAGGTDATPGGTTGAGGADGGGSGVTGSGGGSGVGGSGGGNDECDTNASPKDEACLVADEFAVFVAPDGDDDGDGTMAEPVRSFARAVELAVADGKIVVACNGEYDEHVVVTDAVRVYGRFACPSDGEWEYDDSGVTTVVPSTTGYALEVRDVGGDVVVEDVAFETGDATELGESSIAAFVVGSSDVTLRRVTLTAGNGMDGGDGVLVPFTEDDFPAPMTLNGNPAVTTTGGVANPCECPGGTASTGAKGGDGSPAEAGEDGLPNYGVAGGEGGTPDPTCVDGPGRLGANAPAPPTVQGAQALGTLTASGWTPASGTDGNAGLPGQGGGGGAGSAAGGGGGGGCGGCGGAGGGGGKGGGASIALVVVDSVVVTETSMLVAGNAGDGGDGVGGQAEQRDEGLGMSARGGGGLQGDSFSCAGGAGGIGSPGGPGGGGAGGVSATVVWRGATEPSIDVETTTTFGEAGLRGMGGTPGENDGVDGQAAGRIEL